MKTLHNGTVTAAALSVSTRGANFIWQHFGIGCTRARACVRWVERKNKGGISFSCAVRSRFINARVKQNLVYIGGCVWGLWQYRDYRSLCSTMPRCRLYLTSVLWKLKVMINSSKNQITVWFILATCRPIFSIIFSSFTPEADFLLSKAWPVVDNPFFILGCGFTDCWSV